LEYREWAPNAREVSLVSLSIPNYFTLKFGDFNGWNRDSHKCNKDDFGVWSIVIPKNPDGTHAIKHGSHFKCCITKQDWERVDRIPAWAKYSVQNLQNLLFEAVFWNPEEPYKIKSQRPPTPETLRIYEAHVGMVKIFYWYKVHITRVLTKERSRHIGSSQIMYYRELRTWDTTVFSSWLFKNTLTTHHLVTM
jgi:1,4-alpha-glucan branching enzyme